MLNGLVGGLFVWWFVFFSFFLFLFVSCWKIPYFFLLFFFSYVFDSCVFCMCGTVRLGWVLRSELLRIWSIKTKIQV